MKLPMEIVDRILFLVNEIESVEHVRFIKSRAMKKIRNLDITRKKGRRRGCYYHVSEPYSRSSILHGMDSLYIHCTFCLQCGNYRDTINIVNEGVLFCKC